MTVWNPADDGHAQGAHADQRGGDRPLDRHHTLLGAESTGLARLFDDRVH